MLLTLILMTVVVVSSVASRTSFGAQTNNVVGLLSKATPVVSHPASIAAAPRPDVNPVMVIPTTLSSPFAG